MAAYCHHDGTEVRVALETLAADAGMKERACRKTVRALEAGKWIVATSKRSGGRRTGGNGEGAPITYTICLAVIMERLHDRARARGVRWVVDAHGEMQVLTREQMRQRGHNLPPLPPSKGAPHAPLAAMKGGTKRPVRGHETSAKGAPHAPESVHESVHESPEAAVIECDALDGHQARATTPPTVGKTGTAEAEAEPDAPLTVDAALAVCRELNGVPAGADTPRRWRPLVAAQLAERPTTARVLRMGWQLMRAHFAGEERQPGVVSLLEYWEGSGEHMGWREQAERAVAQEMRAAREAADYDAQRRAEAERVRAEVARRAALSDAERAAEDAAAALAHAASEQRVKGAFAAMRANLHRAGIISGPVVDADPPDRADRADGAADPPDRRRAPVVDISDPVALDDWRFRVWQSYHSRREAGVARGEVWYESESRIVRRWPGEEEPA
jgi:hypothetical protein